LRVKLVTVNDPGFPDGTRFAMCLALGGDTGYQVHGWLYY
jgi:hypothetical protein